MKKNQTTFSVSGVYQKNFFEKEFPKFNNKFLHETTKSTTMDEYIVIFESIFQVEEMYQAFYNHLQYEYCAESMGFLSELEKFFQESKTTTKNLKGLIDKYIKSGGESELNLSYQTKNELIDLLKDQLSHEEWKLKETPEQVFYNVKNAILLQMKMSTFPRFVRKNLCQLVVEKLKFDPKVVLIKKNIEFPYKDEDFAFPLLTDKDINFLKSLSHDSYDWVIISSTPTLNAFWSKKPFMKDVTLYEAQPTVLKYEMILPFSMQRCAASFISTKECEKFESITNRVTVLEEFDHETCKKMMKDKNYEFDESKKRWCYIADWDMSFPFPITTPRKQHGTYSIDYDPSTQTLIKAIRTVGTDGSETKVKKKVFVNKTGPEVEKEVYMTVTIRVDYLQKIDNYKCLYKQIHVFAPNGYSNSAFLQKITIKTIAQRLEKELYDYLKNKKEDTWEDVIKSLKGDPAGRMLEEIDIPQRDFEYKEKELGDLIDKLEISEKKKSRKSFIIKNDEKIEFDL